MRPSGTKSWIVKFTQRRVQKKPTLGSAANLTALEARRKAKEILLMKALDGLPATRPTIYSPIIFGGYVEVFWADYARHWKPLTQYSNWGRIQRDLVPIFGNTPLADISRAQVLRWRDLLAARPSTFNRALPVLAVMMTYAGALQFQSLAGIVPDDGTAEPGREQVLITGHSLDILVTGQDPEALFHRRAGHPADITACRRRRIPVDRIVAPPVREQVKWRALAPRNEVDVDEIGGEIRAQVGSSY